MSKSIKSKKDIIVAIIGAIVVIAAIDLSPLGGNLAVYTNWVQCGGRMPVRSGTRIFDDVPYYESTPFFGLLRGYPKYFCTAEQAERAGFSSSKDHYTYPHLSTVQQQDAYSNTIKIMSK